MQQRNFILFLVLSFIVLFTWPWMQNQIFPPAPKKKDDDPIAKKKDADPKKAAPAVKPPTVAAWKELSEDQRQLAVLLLPPTPLSLAAAHMILWDVKDPPRPPSEDITLGGPKSHIEAVVTTQGAGVRKLVLNKFKAADRLGRPLDEPLELIPEDTVTPSFLMYHYPDDKAEHPVLTLGEQVWTLKQPEKSEDGEIREVQMSTQVPDERFKHLRIVKTYRLEPREYHLTLLLEIHASGGSAKRFRYQLAGAHGLPIEGEWYTSTYRNGVIGQVESGSGLSRTLQDSMRVSHKQGGDPVPPNLALIREREPRQANTEGSFLQYAGVSTQFFASMIVVDDKQPGGGDFKSILAWARPTHESTQRPGRITQILEKEKLIRVADLKGAGERTYHLLPRVQKFLEEANIREGAKVVVNYYETGGKRIAIGIRPGEAPLSYFDDLTVRVNSEAIDVSPGGKVAHQFLLYHGPVKTKLLGQFSGDEAVKPETLVDRYTYELHLRTLTDYRSPGFLGDFSQAIRLTDLLIAVTGLMHWLLYLLHFLCFGSYGLAIILLTVLVRGLMFPISRKQAYFSARMQEMAPEMKKLKEKYPNDKQAQSQAMMELYRKHGVNPLSGCLPLLLQMPIFMGLYFALQESIHFRLAGFVWIRNLAAPDMLLPWSESIPLISDPDNLGGSFFSFLYLGPYFNLLPIIAVGLMLMQQKLMTPPPQDEQQAAQQKMMKYMMVFIGILFYKVAAGLCIYFISSSLWGLAERKFLPKKQATQVGHGLAGPVGPTGKPGPVAPRTGRGKVKEKKEEKPDGALQKVKDWWAEVLKQAKKK